MRVHFIHLNSKGINDSSKMDSDLEKEPYHGPAVAVVAVTKHNCTLVKRPENSGGGGAEVWKISTAGNVVAKQRASLKPDVVSTITFLYGSWKLVEEYWAKRDEEEGKVLVVVYK